MNSSTAIPRRGRHRWHGSQPPAARGHPPGAYPTAPAASRGLRITGNPTAATNSSTSATDEAPVEAAHATPAAREHLLHRRLVTAQVGGARRGPRDRAGLADVGGGHDVGLDRGLEAVDPHRALDLAHGVEQGTLVDDGVHLVIVGHRRFELVVEPVDRTLADADHCRSDLVRGRARTPAGWPGRQVRGRRRS